MRKTKKKIRVGVITKRDQLKTAIGHPEKTMGTGVHRDKKKQPKGGRRVANKKAIEESEEPQVLIP